jgi:hypothetical protein
MEASNISEGRSKGFENFEIISFVQARKFIKFVDFLCETER